MQSLHVSFCWARVFSGAKIQCGDHLIHSTVAEDTDMGTDMDIDVETDMGTDKETDMGTDMGMDMGRDKLTDMGTDIFNDL